MKPIPLSSTRTAELQLQRGMFAPSQRCSPASTRGAIEGILRTPFWAKIQAPLGYEYEDHTVCTTPSRLVVYHIVCLLWSTRVFFAVVRPRICSAYGQGARWALPAAYCSNAEGQLGALRSKWNQAGLGSGCLERAGCKYMFCVLTNENAPKHQYLTNQSASPNKC